MTNNLQRFYHLGGNTVGEHKRNFNTYLKKLNKLNKYEAILTISKLKTRNLQEDLFHLKLLLIYEQYEVLLKNLFKGHRILNKLTIKDRKFCKYVANNITCNYFVENLCPKISYVSRISLMKHMTGAFDKPADSYFNAIREIYGLSEAVLILPSCTKRLIETILKETKCRITEKHLINLHKKFPSIIKFYFENCNHSISEYKALCSYLIYNDPNALDKIPCYGKKNFLKYFAAKEREIIENPLDYLKYFKLINKVMNKKGLSFDAVLRNVFPVNAIEFKINNTIISALNVYPKHLRATKFLNTYEELYGSPYTKPVDTRLLDVIHINDCRAFSMDDSYIEYNPFEISIPFIKNQIKKTSIECERSNLLIKLIRTCKLNQSDEALLEVLKYISKYHRKDTALTRQLVLDEVLKNYKIVKLSEEHWHYLKEILFVFKVNYEHYENRSKYLEMIILKNMKNNVDYMDEFKEYLQADQSETVFNLLPNYPEYQRELMLRYIDALETENEYDLQREKLIFLQKLINFNKRNKKRLINPYDFPYLVDLILIHLNGSHKVKAYLCIEGAFKYTIGFDQKANFAKSYISMNDYFSNHYVYFWVLKSKPNLLLEHMNSIMVHYSNPKFYYELNKMHYLHLRELVFDKAITMFSSTNEERVEKAIPILSNQLNYLDLIKKFPPRQADINKTDSVRQMGLKKKIIESFKNFPFPSDSFQTILKYCYKDYFEDAINMLYFSCFHCKLYLLDQNVAKMMVNNANMRKHIINLTCKFSKLARKHSVFTYLTHAGIEPCTGRYIIASIFRLFLKNRTKTEFNLFVKYITLLSENDSKSMKLALNVNDIPLEFYSKYIQVAWTYLKEKNMGLECKLLQNMNDDIIKVFPKKMCDEILYSAMFEYQDVAQSFVYNYLKTSQNLEIFWIIIDNYMKASYNCKLKLGKKLNKVSQLFNGLILNLIRCKHETSNQTLSLNLFNRYGNSQLSTMLSCTQLKLDLTNQYVQFGLQSFQSYLIYKQYEYSGSELLEIYWESAKYVFDNIVIFCSLKISQWELRMNMLEDILARDQSSAAKMLVLNLMPKPRPHVIELNRVINILEKIKHPINITTQIYYDRYISQ